MQRISKSAVGADSPEKNVMFSDIIKKSDI